MEHLRSVLITIAGYETGMLTGHMVVTSAPTTEDRTSEIIDFEIPAVEPTEDDGLWARRALSAVLAEL